MKRVYIVFAEDVQGNKEIRLVTEDKAKAEKWVAAAPWARYYEVHDIN